MKNSDRPRIIQRRADLPADASNLRPDWTIHLSDPFVVYEGWVDESGKCLFVRIVGEDEHWARYDAVGPRRHIPVPQAPGAGAACSPRGAWAHPPAAPPLETRRRLSRPASYASIRPTVAHL
jgi:hypothetical protein